MEGAINQLHSLSLRNGYTRPTTTANTLPRQHNKQWSAPSYSAAMHIVKAASESGGSSTGEGEASPPLDTTQHGNANQSQSSGSLRNKQPLNLSRLNGGGGDVAVAAVSATTNNNNNELVTSASSGNLPLLMHNFPGYRLQHRQQPFSNGDLMMHAFMVPRSSSSAVPTPYPTNKMVQSCFNCGSTTHTGLNCSEASMEDVTRNAVYKLDYTTLPPPNLPVNNNEAEPAITIIDLTQDTTSSSSSSTSSIHGAK
jgi:hypothetical protein